MSDTQHDDGGPAITALTLADWFAASATDLDVTKHRAWSKSSTGRLVAGKTREEAKYAYADAMIAAKRTREAGPKDGD